MARDRIPAHPVATESEEGFLARWSRRKAAGGAEPAQDKSPEPHAATAADAPAADTASPPALTDADMPPLDTLGPDSDYSPFWSPGVSDELRRLALRKLFASPQFNIRDGLDDYDDDYTIFEPLRKTVAEGLEKARETAGKVFDGDARAAADAEIAASADTDDAPSARDPNEDDVAAGPSEEGREPS